MCKSTNHINHKYKVNEIEQRSRKDKVTLTLNLAISRYLTL